LITWMTSGEEYRAWSSLLCSLLYSPVAFFSLGLNILLSTLFSKTSAYIPPAVWATKFHTHIKQPERL
jgi:hypothetical protein